MKEIKLLGDYVRLKLKEMNIPVNTYILLENLLCLILAAKISFYLPLSDTPVTLLSLMVALIGTIYGVKTGLIGVVVYLLLGVMGIPVFEGKETGMVFMTGSSGGFLAGLLPAVVLAGIFAYFEWDRDIKRSFLLLLIVQSVILASGILWMREGLGIFQSTESIIRTFLPGITVKTILGTLLLKMFWQAIIHTNTSEKEIIH